MSYEQNDQVQERITGNLKVGQLSIRWVDGIELFEGCQSPEEQRVLGKAFRIIPPRIDLTALRQSARRWEGDPFDWIGRQGRHVDHVVPVAGRFADMIEKMFISRIP